MSRNVSKFLSVCISFLFSVAFGVICGYLSTTVRINMHNVLPLNRKRQYIQKEPQGKVLQNKNSQQMFASDIMLRYFFPQRKKTPTTPKAPPDNQFNLNLVSWTITNAQSSADGYSVVSQYEHRLSVTTTETKKKSFWPQKDLGTSSIVMSLYSTHSGLRVRQIFISDKFLCVSRQSSERSLCQLLHF